MKDKNIDVQTTLNVNQVRIKLSTKTKKSDACTGCCGDCSDKKRN
ncbi:hypothetical protein [uncultured Gammaproteobacteria bacterium]|jgi:hypothetical protein|nr:hypothetical protein [uncultured Gammaproteobacteria bacterium]CAC9572567.1 hypothetical protein [uncultured Gammaproteobacteria bacterium]CAC9573783.1 hypothetical protein [uncultured Gammaproteobacteria bacterium]CAC9960633.1 hypothetical protein [uncultured Gammaproteobacteria bacterium]